MPVEHASPKNLDSRYHKKTSRLATWARRRVKALKLKYRIIFDIEANPETRELAMPKKVKEAQALLDETIAHYKAINRWEEREDPEELIISEVDINYFNFRMLRQAPALRAALFETTLQWVEILHFQDHIIRMIEVVNKKLKDGSIDEAMKFWREVARLRSQMESDLRLNSDDRLRRENLALKKAFVRVQEELEYWKSEAGAAEILARAQGKKPVPEGSVLKFLPTKTATGMQEIEGLIKENPEGENHD